jgi:hypothetical protein
VVPDPVVVELVTSVVVLEEAVVVEIGEVVKKWKSRSQKLKKRL